MPESLADLQEELIEAADSLNTAVQLLDPLETLGKDEWDGVIDAYEHLTMVMQQIVKQLKEMDGQSQGA